MSIRNHQWLNCIFNIVFRPTIRNNGQKIMKWYVDLGISSAVTGSLGSIYINIHCSLVLHYIDVIMTTMASQITSLTVVYSTVYSDADQRKHQSSASLAFVWGIHRDRWIPRTKGQLRGKCFHLMTSSCKQTYIKPTDKDGSKCHHFCKRQFYTILCISQLLYFYQKYWNVLPRVQLLVSQLWRHWLNQRWTSSTTYIYIIMTSSNGNRFRVTSPLCKGQWRGALMFFHLRLNKRLSKQSWSRWFETPLRSLWRQSNYIYVYIYISDLAFGLGRCECEIATQWYQTYINDAWWFCLNVNVDVDLKFHDCLFS